MSARAGFQIWKGSKPLAAFEAGRDAGDALQARVLQALGHATGDVPGLWALRDTVVHLAGDALRAEDGRRSAQVGRCLDRQIELGLIESVGGGFTWIRLTPLGQSELFELRSAERRRQMEQKRRAASVELRTLQRAREATVRRSAVRRASLFLRRAAR